LQLKPGTGIPLTGGVYTIVRDLVVANLSVRYPYAGQNPQNAATRLEQMVMDYKSTIASGSWTFFMPAKFQSEQWTLSHEKTAQAKLVYETKYLL
jgi:hypothetical protein